MKAVKFIIPAIVLIAVVKNCSLVESPIKKIIKFYLNIALIIYQLINIS